MTDQLGQSWIQERYYEEGGASKEQGTIARLKKGIAGDDWKDQIERTYKKCCEYSENDEVWLFGAGKGA